MCVLNTFTQRACIYQFFMYPTFRICISDWMYISHRIQPSVSDSVLCIRHSRSVLVTGCTSPTESNPQYLTVFCVSDTQDLCQCLGVATPADPSHVCLTSDDLENPDEWWQRWVAEDDPDTAMTDSVFPVSYTHLTLPTKLSV